MSASARGAILAAAVFVLTAAPSPPTASAAAFCSFEETDMFSPGVSMTPGAYTFTTGDHASSITCQGDAGGKKITGPGTLVDDGQADASSTCASGMGTGDYVLTIPTAGGTVALRFPYSFSYVGGLGYFSSDGFSGGFGIVPTKGDCFSKPATEAKIYGMAQLTA